MFKTVTQLLSVFFVATSVVFAGMAPTVEAQNDSEIRYGDVINGAFTGGGVHSWTFNGRTGDTIVIMLTGNNIAVLLTLQQPNGETVEGVSGDTPSFATLETTLPEDGEYRIFASATEDNANGEYSLSLTGTSADPSAGTVLGQLLSIDGTRDGSDTEYPFDDFAGDTVVISMTSPDFDTFVELRSPEGEIIAYDDDGGIGLNSLIVITLPIDGTYHVVARAYNDEDGGAYSITATSFIPATIEAGEAFVVTSNGEPTIFTLMAEPEQAVSLAVRTLDFDPIVSVRSPNGDTVVFNDDMETDVNSQLDATLTEAGRYFVVVESYDSYTSGTYTIGYNASEEVLAAAPSNDTDTTTSSPETEDIIPIAYGDQIESLLDGESHQYSFVGSADDRITIEMTSNNLDAFIQLLDENGEIVGEDDDSGQAFNAHLETTLPADGIYIIIASVRIGNPVGTFTLRLTQEE